MHNHFNNASLAKLSKSKLYTLLADYRGRLNRAGEAERPAIEAAISAIQNTLAGWNGPD